METKTLPTSRALAAAIAPHLGATVEPGDADNSEHWARLILPGTKLSVSVDTCRKRLKVSIAFPRYDDGSTNVYMYPDNFLPRDQRKSCPTTSISCDPFRDPAKIAADIKRRLMPQALDLYAKALAVIAERQAARNSCLATADRIIAANPEYQRPRNRGASADFTLYGSEGFPTSEIDADGKVHFKSFTVSEKTAQKVLSLLRKSLKV